MTMDVAELQQDAKALKAQAENIARAAQYMKMAADQLKPVVLPVAGKALAGTVRSAGYLGSKTFAGRPRVAAAFGKLAAVEDAQVKRAALVGAAVGAIAVLGAVASGIAKARARRKKRRGEREEEAR